MLIAIGDVHGQVWKLRDLLTKLHELPLADDDRLVFLGDYVDRGPEVALTLDVLIQLKRERPNTIFLRGNHDQAMLDVRDLLDPARTAAVTPEELSWWFLFGGSKTISSYGGGKDWRLKVPPEHWEFLESTTIEHREGGYIFVHAGLLPPRFPWVEKEDPRLWIRETFIESDADFGGIVVYGHTPTPRWEPLIRPNKIGMDTGAGKDGPLTAALLIPHEPAAVRFVVAE